MKLRLTLFLTLVTLLSCKKEEPVKRESFYNASISFINKSGCCTPYHITYGTAWERERSFTLIGNDTTVHIDSIKLKYLRVPDSTIYINQITGVKYVSGNHCGNASRVTLYKK